jgi:3-phenylpropionate/cinnamic acid dioxygenase small subunit
MAKETKEEQAILDGRVARLLYTYALAVDTGDLEALRSIAAADVQFTANAGTLTGLESFLDVYRSQFASGTEQIRHVVTNVLANRLADGQIQVQAYFEATMFEPDQTQRLIGSYHDILREVDGELKLAHKKIRVQRVLQLPTAHQDWVSASAAVVDA